MSDQKAVIDELLRGFEATSERVVPWFSEQMPEAYFKDTDHETRLSHLRAIIAAKASGLPLQMTLRSGDDSTWTFINERDHPGLLADLVQFLPEDQPLRGAKVHSARDGSLVLDSFDFGPRARCDLSDPEISAKVDALLGYATHRDFECSREEIAAQVERSSSEYITTVTPLRFFRNMARFARVSGTDDTLVELEQEEADRTQSRVVFTVGNSTPRHLFGRIADYLGHHRIDVRRAYLDVFDDGESGWVSQLSFVVKSPDGDGIDPAGALWKQVQPTLLRMKWLDDGAIQLVDSHPALGFLRAEVLQALKDLVHQLLCHENAYAYARDRISMLVGRHIEIGCEIADLFMDRFNPNAPLSEEAFEARAAEIRASVERDVDLHDTRRIFFELIRAVAATLRTNVHHAARYGLALRLDPAYLTRGEHPEPPYGVFFVVGRGFTAFHVRFRDIARGGVRVVHPLGLEQYAVENERLYDEAYFLAHAQQLKNKDIPEGGAKAVVLVRPEASVTRAVKGLTDALLDLITPGAIELVDLAAPAASEPGGLRRPELLYLGPDERISAQLIEWIAKRAERRGYPLASAFMSSKPGAGINHKEYGVTSEGVTVFLHEALRSVGIDPEADPFTVKLTGGPDGDVAGNQIKILARDYRDRARIVGIADGTGCAEDSDGLDIDELLRLVERSEAIAAFDRGRLGPRGRVVSVDEPGGVKLRNTLHNRVRADAFVPAGGRPRTIRSDNWRDYLGGDGAPSSRVVVEGANLFFTPEARARLSEHGAVIVRDSSANKCGVICSSFEIAASMLLSEAEFLEVKARFVSEVLVKLRALARAEAELLFREHRRYPEVALPDHSARLSEVMNRACDGIEEALAGLGDDDGALARDLVRAHLPAVLVERAGERLFSVLPPAYLNRTVAASLAGLIVYREGLDYIEAIPAGAIGELAIRYLRQERETERLIESVAGSSLAERERIAFLLRRGGTRAALAD